MPRTRLQIAEFNAVLASFVREVQETHRRSSRLSASLSEALVHHTALQRTLSQDSQASSPASLHALVAVSAGARSFAAAMAAGDDADSTSGSVDTLSSLGDELHAQRSASRTSAWGANVVPMPDDD